MVKPLLTNMKSPFRKHGEKAVARRKSAVTVRCLKSYSGKAESHLVGVAAILGPKVTKTLCSWKLVSERTQYARFISNNAKLLLIVCYAPTTDADDTLEDEFYDNLQSLIDSIPLQEVTCILGDFNGKVGQDRSYFPELMGHHGLGTINENGARGIGYGYGE
ncbi:hypothetical protein QYM36_018082 [Artemia franciscana]|uniref:Craniofacial development protein 2-like n=1 Tax=Artemia franciscana TaxID=6661 RepID=A0AA88HDP9_ARTSF|nr:hypothetical protein QYM36_018082 [Artemia franciscana]